MPMTSDLTHNIIQASVAVDPVKQRYLVTVQRNGRKKDEANLGELTTLALREIPECSDICIIGRSQFGIEASFWADAYQLTRVLERHLNHFGLTWVSLELLDLSEDSHHSIASGVSPTQPDQHAD
jgi:hypothetical protein